MLTRLAAFKPTLRLKLFSQFLKAQQQTRIRVKEDAPGRAKKPLGLSCGASSQPCGIEQNVILNKIPKGWIPLAPIKVMLVDGCCTGSAPTY
jgi:hypothetical protein